MKTLLLVVLTSFAPLLAQAPAVKPADLTDAEKLTAYAHVSKLRGVELAKRQLTESAEKAIREYRDKVVKQLQSDLEKLDTDAKTEAAALEKELAAKSKPGWRLNPDSGMKWEQIPAPPQDQPSKTTEPAK